MKDSIVKRILTVITLFILGFLIGTIIFGCNPESVEPKHNALGKQYYRMTQFDFDGTETVYYSSPSLVENNNSRKELRDSPLSITCETDGVSLFIGLYNTWITIDNSYHGGYIILDADTLAPIFCTSYDCTWAKANSQIIENRFTTNLNTYEWSGTPFDCESLPIELLEFSVKPNNDGTNTITIITASEVNADYIILERSPDFETWSFVDMVYLENNPTGHTYIIID